MVKLKHNINILNVEINFNYNQFNISILSIENITYLCSFMSCIFQNLTLYEYFYLTSAAIAARGATCTSLTLQQRLHQTFIETNFNCENKDPGKYNLKYVQGVTLKKGINSIFSKYGEYHYLQLLCVTFLDILDHNAVYHRWHIKRPPI